MISRHIEYLNQKFIKQNLVVIDQENSQSDGALIIWYKRSG